MKSRRLGRTGLYVSEICMGTMTFGSMADEAESRRILDKSFEAGVDFFDIAEVYPVPPNPKWAGRSEEIVGRWMADKPRDRVCIATKIAGPSGGWFRAAVRNGRTALDRHNVERAVDDSLRRLGTDYIDLYQTHWPDPDLPIEQTLEALDRVVSSGKVRYVGCSNQTAYGLTRSLWKSELHGLVRYETIQNNFSLLNRRFEDELAEVCRREGVSLLPYSPIAGGVLSGKYQGGAWPEGARFSAYKNDPERGSAMARRFINEKTLGSVERFQKIAADAGLSVTTLAVAWSIAHDFVGSTIVGATSVDQVDALVAGSGLKLTDDILSACDQVSREILYPMG